MGFLGDGVNDAPAMHAADTSISVEHAADVAREASDFVLLVDRPRRWSMRFIAWLMIEFGLLSSVFDTLTFVTLLAVFHAGPTLFRTGWFVESLLTDSAIALIAPTRRPFFLSPPGGLLLWANGPLFPYADIRARS